MLVMKVVYIALFSSGLALALVSAESPDGEVPQPTATTPNKTTTIAPSPEPQPVTTTVPTTPPTHPTTAPTTPPTHPTTTTVKTTTPSTPPTTPTTPPTTSSPNTTTATTSTTSQTTTSSGTTTTSAPSTTTTQKPSPKPPQKPDIGNWNVTDYNIKETCILVDMAIQLDIHYTSTQNMTKHGIIDIPKELNATGECGNNTQTFILTWPSKTNKTNNSLELVFTKNDTTKHFMISQVNVTVVPDDETVFPDIKDKNVTTLYNNKTEFSTPVSKSYHCVKEQSFDLFNSTNGVAGKITVSHVQLEAFHKKMDHKFGAVQDCEPSSSPDIVPIAVGCALVGLVGIVLVAYLVGRRRSQARGYLSM